MTDRLATGKATGAWKFDADVVAQFDSHVAASVRGYSEIQATIGRVADWAAPDGAKVIDIGCSTGTTFDVIQSRHPRRTYHFVGYDTSPEMVASAVAKMADRNTSGTYTDIYEHDVLNGLKHEDADLNIAVFTVQFVNPYSRVALLSELLRCSKPGAVLLLAEKTIPQDPRWALICAEASWEDKRIAGFSGDEIVAKAEALRGVLRPVSELLCVQEAITAGWEAPQVLWASWNWRLYGFIAPEVSSNVSSN